MLAISEAGEHSPIHTLEEVGGGHHLPGHGDLGGTVVISADDIRNKQSINTSCNPVISHSTYYQVSALPMERHK